MQGRNVTVKSGEGWSAATFALIAVVIVAFAALLFVWQPWNQPRANTTTVITQPGSNSQGNAGPSTSGSSSQSGGASGGSSNQQH